MLDIVSDPPGAQVFVDDELVGRTDPETGRLRLTTLSPGRHRVRVSADGREDIIREVDLAQRDLLVDARLVESPAPAALPAPPVEAPARSPMPRGTVAGLLAASLAVVLLVARVLRHRRANAPPRTPSTVSDPGTDEVFPRPFGDYSLLRRIGKGGMAAVYEATRDGETVALKRPLSGFVDDDRFRERFLHEAELGHTLHHPNIIRIFDHGRVGDTPYFTMELLRGETLATRLDREGRLELSEAMRIVAQVAEALDYAHSKGVIHRDLKPSNIMVGPDGTVTVMDYGVARARHVDDVTTTRAFLGTPSYGAPETVQAASQPASDLYSSACSCSRC